MKLNWQTIVRKMYAEVYNYELKLNVFYQDRFYSSGKAFGYPICIEMTDLQGAVMERHVLGYAYYTETCTALVQVVEQFITDLNRGHS